jgi:hypothetical protein
MVVVAPPLECPELAEQVAFLMARCRQMDTRPPGGQTTPAGAEAAVQAAREAGDELLVWVDSEEARPAREGPPKKGGRGRALPQSVTVSVYDVPTGLLLTERTSRGTDCKLTAEGEELECSPSPLAIGVAISLLRNRNWREGGSG